jgi:uncharacterized membrane protein (UPF0127 family)
MLARLLLIAAVSLPAQPLTVEALPAHAPQGLRLADAGARPAGLLELASFPRSELRIVRGKGAATHEFRVWIADTGERQMQGLMFVRDLPANEGMLFVHDRPRVASMWMKNTFIPLDMLFIDAQGRIVTIHQNTTPHSLEPLSSGRPVLAVLELRGGEVARRGIKPGDRVVHGAFRVRPDRGANATTG